MGTGVWNNGLLPVHLLPAVFCPLPLDLLVFPLLSHILSIGLDPVTFSVFAGINSYKEEKEILRSDKDNTWERWPMVTKKPQPRGAL